MTRPPSQSPLTQAFAQGPTWFPQQMDAATDRVLLVRMAEEDYRQASFLDQRMLNQKNQPQWAEWAELEAADQAGRADAYFIFHIGHVGSTLIARLLGELDGVFALREPQILRNFADLAAQNGAPHALWSPRRFDARLETAIGWLSRTFAQSDRALIKASSFVSEIAAPMLGETRKALFLRLSPERYIETILAGDNSRQELAMLASPRLQRLHKRLGSDNWKLWELPEPVRAAMSWLSEMMALDATAQTAPTGNIHWLDFDDFLQDPVSRLGEIAAFYGLDSGKDRLSAIANGPLMTQYSKAPEHDYSPDIREKLLAEARATHQEGIAKGLTWLKDAAAQHETIARLMTEHARA
ncbi:sulfotransferase domain-containing protein [Parasphingopyxis lamellibrachiae]|uniref:Sulfotransferase family protein n=1 Tax=Parasphingopyxis lamellibrachiae TaxID=680125 RepID=A0A3D9FDJ9_9SPHN|nr:sulfotransferase domain-containing protein [Parasphingopyxis lamellibrachiae]RED15905.1 hypothetical protein DFR46_0913 [Parasphingopyxis lamellibrachiae]